MSRPSDPSAEPHLLLGDLILGDDALGRQLRQAPALAPSPQGGEGWGEGATETRIVYVAQSRSGQCVPDLEDAEHTFAALPDTTRELVVVSSTQVFEPHHRHLSMTPKVELPPGQPTNRVAIAWRCLEDSARTVAEGRGVALTLLRAAPIVVPRGRDFWSRLLRRRIAFTYPGFDPTLQLLSVDDLAQALATLKCSEGGDGVRVIHLVPRSNVPLRKALWRAGALRIPVPRWIQSLVRPVVPGAVSVDQVDYLRHSFTVSPSPPGERAGVRGPSDQEYAPAFDPYGLDKDYIRRLSKTLFRFLHDVWWRVDVRGVENLPQEGPVVLVGIHRGFQPWDGVMIMQHLASKTGRYARFLTHPTLLKFPFLAPYMQKLGAVPAAAEGADWVLSQNQVLAVFPEGIRGAFLKYGPDVYEPSRFQPDFVAFALRHGAPIVPFVTVGPAEIYPILKKLNWSWWKRLSEWPCLPVTPTLGTVPLPSKWHTRILPPVHLEGNPDDSIVVRRLSRQIRKTMADDLADLVRRRRHVFWGDLAPEGAPKKTPSSERSHSEKADA